MRLPLNTWIVVEQNPTRLVSKHLSQKGAEAERDRHNCSRAGAGCALIACVLVEPVAERMGGHTAPTS